MIPPRRRYPTDLTDAEWQLLAPLIPAAKPGGRPPIHDRRELVNAMAYWVRAGCAWRLLPHDLPPWQTVDHYLALLAAARVMGAGPRRTPHPGASPARTAANAQRGGPRQPECQDHRPGGPHGYDGAKKVNGRKRHLLVDTLGLVCKVHVTAADTGDRQGATALLRRLDRRHFPRLRHGWADGGYRGPFLDWARGQRGIAFHVVQRSDGGRRRRWLPPDATPPIVPPFAVAPAGGWWSAPSRGWAASAA